MHYHLLDSGQADLGAYRTKKQAKETRHRIITDRKAIYRQKGVG